MGMGVVPAPSKIGNASLFTKILFTIFVPINPPLPTRKMRDSSCISIRRTSSRIANTQPQLRTDPPKIANKQNYEQTGVPEKTRANLSAVCAIRANSATKSQTPLPRAWWTNPTVLQWVCKEGGMEFRGGGGFEGYRAIGHIA